MNLLAKGRIYKRSLSLILTAVALNWSTAAHASSFVCRLWFNSLISAEFEGQNREDIISVISRIDEITTPLTSPAPLIGKLGVDGMPVFRSTHNEILVNFDTKRSREEALDVIAHEYGHALLEANLPVEISGKVTTMAEAMRALQKNKDLMKHGAKVDLVPAQKAISELKHFIEIHNELFADMVAVMHSGKSAAHPNRDFASPVTIETFKSGNGEFGHWKYENLNPSRHYIWQKYLYRRDVTTYPILLQAMINVMVRQSKIPRKPGFIFTWQIKEFNQEFMKMFDEEVGSLTAMITTGKTPTSGQ